MTDNFMDAFLSHESTEWYTPESYVELARTTMGSIDLDPASSELANETVRAEMFYTRTQNGLIQPWFGNIWLNPPYSKTSGQSNQEIWAERMREQYETGQIQQGILLVKAAIGYNWFTRVWKWGYPVCFTHRLISFERPHLPEADDGASKLGSAIFYFGKDVNKFSRIFSEIGFVVLAPQKNNVYYQISIF